MAAEVRKQAGRDLEEHTMKPEVLAGPSEPEKIKMATVSDSDMFQIQIVKVFKEI